MIPKINQALRKFIEPISSANRLHAKVQLKSQSTKSEGALDSSQTPINTDPDEKGRSDKEPEKEETSEQSSEETQIQLKREASAQPTDSETLKKSLSVPEALLELFSLFSGKSKEGKPSGKASYDDVLRFQKRAGRFRKGTMVDEKAD